MKSVNYAISYSKRIMLLICSVIFCFIAAAFLISLLNHICGLTPAIFRIEVILQNFIAMILPAIITVVIISRAPLNFLCLDKKPTLLQITLMILILVVATPMMNLLVAWNESIHLPESFAILEQYLRSMENAAAVTTEYLLSNNSIFSLIVTILAVGVFTGFAEELLFRGTLQRIFQSRPTNIHIAIWVTAAIFSFIHFQFFGFFPRLLLGAFFGYLLWWTKSLWASVLAHAINNSVVVVYSYIYGIKDAISHSEAIGVGANNSITAISIISIVLTIALLYIFNKISKNK